MTTLAHLERRSAISAAVIAGLGLLLYVAIIVLEGENDVFRVALIAGILATAAASSWAGTFAVSPRARSFMLSAAAGILLVMGYLALFSIGLVFLIAGVPAVVAAFGELSRSGRNGSALLGFGVGVSLALVPMMVPA